MKKQIAAAMLAFGAAGSALAQVGVSVGINEPGVYGRVDFGQPPPPVALVQPRPIYVTQPRRGVALAPLYLYVPVAEQRDWRRYCGRYDACGQPVYFVRDAWVRDRYEHQHPGWDRGRRGGPDRADGRGRDDRGGQQGRDMRDDHGRGGQDDRGGDRRRPGDR